MPILYIPFRFEIYNEIIDKLIHRVPCVDFGIVSRYGAHYRVKIRFDICFSGCEFFLLIFLFQFSIYRLSQKALRLYKDINDKIKFV